MSQHDMDLANQAGAAFRADANLALAALVSNNSGATAPATTFAYMWWADTATGLLKQRNAANSAWITVGLLSGIWASPGSIGSTTPAAGAFTTLSASGAVTVAAAQEVTLAGSSGTNFGRLSYSSSGNTALLLDNGFDSASAEIRLRLRTLGSTVNGLVLTPTTALVPGSLSAASVTGAMVAAASDQETGTSATVVVTPSVQQRHASATKAWIKCNEAGGIHASYNVTSITDTGTGALTVTWDTDFSSVHYKTNGTAESGSQYFVTVGTPAAGSCTYNCWRSDTAALVDPTAYHIDANGDQ